MTMKLPLSWRLFGLLLPLVVVPFKADAAPSEAGHYQRCLADSSANPAAALADAEAWAKAGGGVPAQHCAALALVSLKRYAEAASRLDKAASGPEKLEAQFRTELY